MEFIRNGKLTRFIAISLAIGALIGIRTGAHGQNANELPFDTPTQIDGVEAVCTGVSLDAREDPRWNVYSLKVEIAGKGGQYLGDVHVTVARDSKRMFEVTCGGPWLLFRLPAARYQVSASIESETVSSTAFVPASGQGRIIIRFPERGGELESVADRASSAEY